MKTIKFYVLLHILGSTNGYTISFPEAHIGQCEGSWIAEEGKRQFFPAIFYKADLFDGTQVSQHFLPVTCKLTADCCPEILPKITHSSDIETGPLPPKIFSVIPNTFEPFYNPKTRTTVFKNTAEVHSLNDLPNSESTEIRVGERSRYSNTFLGSSAGGMAGFFIGNAVFDLCIKPKSDQFTYWLLKKPVFSKKDQVFKQRCLKTVSVVSRLFFNSIFAVVAVGATFKLMTRKK